MASWLVRSTPDRAVWVRVRAGHIVLCSWTRHFTLTVPLSTQVYKRVPATFLNVGGVNLRWTSIPSREEYKYSKSLRATETGISSDLMGHWLVCRLNLYRLACVLSLIVFCRLEFMTKRNDKSLSGVIRMTLLEEEVLRVRHHFRWPNIDK